MSEYLLTNTVVSIVATEEEAQEVIQKAKDNRYFELVSYKCEHKFNHKEDAIMDEYFKITLVEKFNDEKLPDARVKIEYGVDF